MRLARGAGVELGDVEMTPSVRSVVTHGRTARHLVIGDVFSGVAQSILAVRGRGATTLLDDGASSLHAASALRNEVRMARPRESLGGRRQILAALARTRLQRDAAVGRVGMFTAFVEGGVDLIGVERWGNEFRWSRRVELDRRIAPRRRVVFGSALAVDGLITEDAYHRWLSEQVVEGSTLFLPHRRESAAVSDLVRSLGADTVVSGGWPGELVVRDMGPTTEFCTLPSTAALTVPRLRAVTDLRCNSVPVTWWTPAAPAPMRALASRIARLAATASGQVMGERTAVIEI